MVKFLVTLAGAIWLTSTIIMLVFYACARVQANREGIRMVMPVSTFLIQHFCPIVHTVRAIRMLIILSKMQD